MPKWTNHEFGLIACSRKNVLILDKSLFTKKWNICHIIFRLVQQTGFSEARYPTFKMLYLFLLFYSLFEAICSTYSLFTRSIYLCYTKLFFFFIKKRTLTGWSKSSVVKITKIVQLQRSPRQLNSFLKNESILRAFSSQSLNALSLHTKFHISLQKTFKLSCLKMLVDQRSLEIR